MAGEEFRLLMKRSKRRQLEDNLYGEMKLFGLPLPQRQFRFHPKREWSVDFAWPELQIIVEVQGGLYMGGGHNRGAYMEKEYEKHNEATKLGWRVYRFGPKACYIKKRSRCSSQALEFLYGMLCPQRGQDTKKAASALTPAASLFSQPNGQDDF